MTMLLIGACAPGGDEPEQGNGDPVASTDQSVTTPVCTAVRMTAPTAGFVVNVGSPVTLIALATCPPGTNIEYQYWAKAQNAANWTILGAYVPGSSSWPIPSAGVWSFSAVARAVGAPGYQARSPAVTGTANGGANRNPIANADAITTTPGVAGSVNVLLNDSDPDGNPLSVTGHSTAAHGTVSFSGGMATYTSTAGYLGADSFTYTLSDGAGGSATGTVSVTVNTVVDRPPVAVNDTLARAAGSPGSTNVLLNDSDPDGDPLTVASFTPGAHGTVAISGGLATYTPNAGWIAGDSFTYTISDGRGRTAVGTVTVTITAPTPGCTISISGPASGIYGQNLHLTATAQCNTGAAQVQWYHRLTAGYAIVQAYSTTLTLDYAADTVGANQFYALVRTQGTSPSQGTSNTLSINAVDNTPQCMSVTLVSPTTNQVLHVGLAQTLTASAACPPGAVAEYQFWIKPAAAANWQVLPAYTTTTGSWTPSVTGPWVVKAVARTIGSHVSYQVASAGVGVSVTDPPPTALTYTLNPATYTKGQAIASNSPSSTGGAVVSYAISPALPAGLAFSTVTGVISGTPTAMSATTGRTVTATNAGGSTTATVTITVNDLPPTAMSYSAETAIYTKGQAITNNAPSVAGGTPTSYSILPALPAGLAFSTVTGVISGTPTVLSPATSYTATATNVSGSVDDVLTITVHDAAPSTLTYTMNPASYTKGQAITTNMPSASGGAVVSYSVSPALPAGLGLDTLTGDITGTPTTITAQATYTVTATNTGGTTTLGLVVTIHDAAPTSLVYSTNPATYIKDAVIATNTPSSSGGAVVSYGVSPALPAGLSLDTSTGAITGTPTAVTAIASYTVTATNTGGSTTASLSITVDPPAPTLVASTIASGGTHTCAVVDGGVQCWGYNSAGQLGNGTAIDAASPVRVIGLSLGAQATTAGDSHSCALVSGGVQCWGYNFYGQLGNNSTTDSYVPVPVFGLEAGVQAIAAGDYQTCALMDGGVQCWGYDSNANNSVPVPVAGLTSGVQAIAAGAFHSCALADGGVQCWGANDHGQLGDGSTIDSSEPVQVVGLTSGVLAIAAGGSQTCALVTGGGVQCWGDNWAGQLGNGSSVQSAVPIQVTGLTSGVQAITVGGSHACAIKTGGGAWCWGYNDYGQLGDGTNDWSTVPVQVSGLTSGVQAITAGYYHTCALIAGAARCWGNNGYQQLGNNSGADSNVPVPVNAWAPPSS